MNFEVIVLPDLVVAAGGDHILEALETELHEGDVAKGLHLLSTVVIGAGLGYNEVLSLFTCSI